jgi:hypothetical protein
MPNRQLVGARLGKGDDFRDRFDGCSRRGHEHDGRHGHKRDRRQIPLRSEAHIAADMRIDGQNARRSDLYQVAIGRRSYRRPTSVGRVMRRELLLPFPWHASCPRHHLEIALAYLVGFVFLDWVSYVYPYALKSRHGTHRRV